MLNTKFGFRIQKAKKTFFMIKGRERFSRSLKNPLVYELFLIFLCLKVVSVISWNSDVHSNMLRSCVPLVETFLLVVALKYPEGSVDSMKRFYRAL